MKTHDLMAAHGAPGPSPAAARRLVTALFLALGAGGCARTVNDYLREAESGAPEAVREAIVAIGDLLEAKETAGIEFDEGDRAALEYLRKLAGESPIPTQRDLAIQGLGRLRSLDSTDIFLRALEDSFWMARFKAVEALAGRPRETFTEPLAKLLERETQPEVRLEIVRALRLTGGPLAIRVLFETFLNRSSRRQDEQVHAFRALRELTGLEHSFDDQKSWEKSFRERFPPRDEGTGS